MPIPLSKEDTFKISLKSDEHLAEEVRPWFEFVFLTGRQQKQLAKDLEFEKGANSIDVLTQSFDTVRVLLRCWGNLRDKEGKSIPYNPAKLEDYIQFQEAQELAWKIFGFAPEFEEVKNLESQSPLSTEKSADPEPVDDAKTP